MFESGSAAINTSLAVSYIKSHNIFQYVVGNRLPDGSYSGAINPVIVYNGIPFGTGIFYGGGAIDLAPLPGFGNIFIGNSDGKATYAAFYLQADKPYTDVGLGIQHSTDHFKRAIERRGTAHRRSVLVRHTERRRPRLGPSRGLGKVAFRRDGHRQTPVRRQAFDDRDFVVRPIFR